MKEDYPDHIYNWKEDHAETITFIYEYFRGYQLIYECESIRSFAVVSIIAVLTLLLSLTVSAAA